MMYLHEEIKARTIMFFIVLIQTFSFSMTVKTVKNDLFSPSEKLFQRYTGRKNQRYRFLHRLDADLASILLVTCQVIVGV